MWRKLFCTKTDLLNFNVTLPLVKLYIAVSKLVSNPLIFSDYIFVNIQLVTFFIAI